MFGSARPRGRPRAAVTPAELLALAGVGGILVALALPAVRQVQESAGRARHAADGPGRDALQPPGSSPGGGGWWPSLGHADSRDSAPPSSHWGLNGSRNVCLGSYASFACPYDPAANPVAPRAPARPRGSTRPPGGPRCGRPSLLQLDAETRTGQSARPAPGRPPEGERLGRGAG
jgi:hypothetical protein